MVRLCRAQSSAIPEKNRHCHASPADDAQMSQGRIASVQQIRERQASNANGHRRKNDPDRQLKVRNIESPSQESSHRVSREVFDVLPEITHDGSQRRELHGGRKGRTRVVPAEDSRNNSHVVQGITELLPISSTAHMRIVPAILGWNDPGSAFSAAMQLAALAAVMSYFWQDVKDLTTNSVRALLRRRFDNPDFQLSIWIVLATMPIGIAGLALSDLLNACNSPLRHLSVIGWACVAMAILLGIAELCARHRRTIGNATLADALLIGVAQVGALIPGVSRSGSTLTAALALGFKREEAARFLFLLGLPAIALAGNKELWELHKIDLDIHGWYVLASGFSSPRYRRSSRYGG